MSDEDNSIALMYQTISDLPQPNRDTLAFLLIHLQRSGTSPCYLFTLMCLKMMCGVLNYIYVFLFLLYRLSAFLLIARVSQSSDTRMNVTNLARVFGPTIVGHAVADPDPMTILQDTKRQPKV